VEAVLPSGVPDAVVIVADDRVETSESTDVEKSMATVEGSGVVTLFSSDTTTEVTTEILFGGETVWVTGVVVAEKCRAVVCAGKILADKDIAVLSVGAVLKLVSNMLVVEAPRGLNV
jgi:hypothetical protein